MRTLLIILLLGLVAAASSGRARRGSREYDKGHRGRGGRGGYRGRGGRGKSGGFEMKRTFERCYGEDAVKMYAERQDTAFKKCFGIEKPKQFQFESYILPDWMFQKIVKGDLSFAMDGSSSEEGYRYGSRSWSGSWSGSGSNSGEDDDNFNLGLEVSFPSESLVDVLSMMSGRKRGGGRMKGGMFGGRNMGRGEHGGNYAYGNMGRGEHGDNYGYGNMGRGERGYGNMFGGGYTSKEYDDFDSIEKGIMGGMGPVMKGNMGGMGPEMNQLEKILSAVMGLTGGRGIQKRSADPVTQEKLIAKLKTLQPEVMAMYRNMTCIMKEMNMVVDDEGTMDLDALIAAVDDLGIEDEWLLGKLKLIANTCYDKATSSPTEYLRMLMMNEKFARAFAFNKCKVQTAYEICQYKEVKDKLEEDFGPLSELASEAGMDEDTVVTLSKRIMGRNKRKCHKKSRGRKGSRGRGHGGMDMGMGMDMDMGMGMDNDFEFVGQ